MSATLTLVPIQRKMQVRQADSVEALFAGFWQAYPRKIARGAALTAYRRALKKVSTDPIEAAAVILDGLRRCRFSPDPQYRPHASTWLNGERWADEDDAGGIDPVLAAAGLTVEDFQ